MRVLTFPPLGPRARLFAALLSLVGAGVSAAGEFGRGLVETTNGERIEGMISFEKSGLSVTGNDGAKREIAPENLLVARRGESAAVPTGQATPRGLRATYFKTKELSGDSQARIDGKIDFGWGWESPMPGFEPERFSVRWEGFLETRDAGNYAFHVLSNDGARLLVDGRLVVDEWHDQSETEHSGQIALEAGKRYPFRMEMYEQGGTATAKLFWTPPGGAREIIPEDRFSQPEANAPAAPNPLLETGDGHGLRGRYFASRNLDGFSAERLDPEVNFNWAQNDPGVDAGIGRDNFSVRWEGWLEGPLTGKVTFIARADDGVRLWVDERQIIDHWHDGAATDYTGQIDLEKGKKYPIKLEYYENASEAAVSLAWQADGLGREIIPSRFMNPGRSGDSRAPYPMRLRLRGGSILFGNLAAADERTVTILTRDGELAVPARGIAMLQFGDLPDDRMAALLSGKPGALMRDRDFFEAEFLGLAENRLRFSSILFGLKSVELGKVLAVKTGTLKERPAKFLVKASGDAMIRANEIVIEGDQVRLLDNSFSRLVLPLKSVEEVRGASSSK